MMLGMTRADPTQADRSLAGGCSSDLCPLASQGLQSL